MTEESNGSCRCRPPRGGVGGADRPGRRRGWPRRSSSILEPGGDAHFRSDDEIKTGWVEERRPGRRAADVLVGGGRRARDTRRADARQRRRQAHARCASSRLGRWTCSTWSGCRCPASAAGRTVPRWWRPERWTAETDPRRRRVRRARRSHAARAAGSDRRAAGATATELAAELPISRQAVLKHLNALTDAGPARPRALGREMRYRLTPAPLSEAVSWMAEVGAQWDDRWAPCRRSSVASRRRSPNAGPADRLARRDPEVRHGPADDLLERRRGDRAAVDRALRPVDDHRHEQLRVLAARSR